MVMVEILQSTNTKRPALSRPRNIGDRTARNRLVMGPLCTMYAAPDGSTTPQLIDYYRARAGWCRDRHRRADLHR
jgi:2,4-dienoyl-CoA reductase-like NADH-dependent reductase (Old Yellow Enzyme family)